MVLIPLHSPFPTHFFLYTLYQILNQTNNYFTLFILSSVDVFVVVVVVIVDVDNADCDVVVDVDVFESSA